MPSGGKRAGAGRRRTVQAYGEAVGATPFSIAAGEAARKKARTEDDAEELGGEVDGSLMPQDVDWTCSACTFDHDTPELRMLQECSMCREPRGTGLAAVTADADMHDNTSPAQRVPPPNDAGATRAAAAK